MARHAEPQPPAPPPLARTYAPHRYQVFGVGVMVALIVAAVAGTFGPSSERGMDRADALHLEIEYPSRWRNGGTFTLAALVTNASERTHGRVDVAFDRGYVEAYAATDFEPAIAHVTEDAFVVSLFDLRAGETRRVTTTLLADALGRTSGSVAATTGDSTAHVPLRSFVFP
jgi:hypothetical protein